MAKVVVATLKTKRKSATPRKPALAEKRVRDHEGHSKVLRVLDAGSSTFGDDLRNVFEKNVAKARRDNKRLTGAADVALPKR